MLKKNKINSTPLNVRIFTAFVMAFAFFVSAMPLGWLLLSSLKEDPLARPGFMLPEKLYFGGYITVFRDIGITRYFSNSLFVATISVVLSILMISMSAYVVARMNFKLKGIVSACLLSTLFIPAASMTYPVYSLINKLGLFNTHGALIFIYTCSGIAVSFFVIKNYYATIPTEMEEAARIDGCGYVQTWIRIMLPLAMPGIMTAAVLAFLGNWNEYYWASLVLIDRKLLTIPALLSNFTTAFTTDYNGLFSAIVVIIVPPILLFCFCSRFFVQALSGGAV
ncbi:MAG: carbohydrate ABC transporter permease, partial [Christensenellaceae bacterium]